MEASAETPRTTPVFGPIGIHSGEPINCFPPARPFKRDHILARQSGECEAVYWIESGIVKNLGSHLSGRETILGLRARGWIVGAGGILSRMPSLYTAVTVTPCMLRVVPRKDFERLYLEHATVARHVSLMLAAELAARVEANSEIRQASALVRLEHFLRECAECPADVFQRNPLSFLKQKEVAEILSVTPEHLSRLLAQLRKTGSLAQDLSALSPNMY